MKNFVWFARKICGTLFLGYPTHPYYWSYRHETKELLYRYKQEIIFPEARASTKIIEEYPIEIELDPNLIVTFHQTGGHTCLSQPLFGVFFPLKDEGLIALANEYYKSGMTTQNVTLENIMEWRSKINDYGLDLNGLEHHFMQEGFLPVGFSSAFEYAKKESLDNLIWNGEVFSQSRWIDNMKNHETALSWFSDVVEALSDWSPDAVPRSMSSKLKIMTSMRPLIGAIVVENSD